MDALVAAGDLHQVIYGEGIEKIALKRLPCAIIQPGHAVVSRTAALASVNEFAVQVRGEVVVLIRESEPSDWFTQIIVPLGKVADKLFGDSTLNGAAVDAFPAGFAPGEVRVTNKLYYGGTVPFEALTAYLPS